MSEGYLGHFEKIVRVKVWVGGLANAAQGMRPFLHNTGFQRTGSFMSRSFIL